MATNIDYDTALRIMYVTAAPVAGTLLLDIRRDIYSAVKLDWKTDGVLNKLKFPFRTSGGDAVIPNVKYIGNYVFLQYGWRMRPYEADHALYLSNGYLLVDGGGDPWLVTLGGYTVNVRDSVPADAITLETGVSGVSEQDKTDIAGEVWDLDVAPRVVPNSAATALKAGTYEGYITLDVDNGFPGTGWPIGTHFKPSNNLADALTIMLYGNVNELVLLSDLTVGAAQDVSEIVIRTAGIMGTTITFEAGARSNKTAIRYANVEGDLYAADEMLLESCTVLNITGFKGVMNNVAFGQGAEVTFAEWAQIIQGTAGGEPTNEVEFNIGTASLNVSQWTGNLKLKGKTGTDRTIINCNSGNIIIDGTCTAGKIQLLGVGYLEADNSGAGCDVDVSGFITNEFIAEHVWAHADAAFLKDIEGGRWHIVNNQMIFYKADNLTEVARFDLFDAAGAPASENVYQRTRVAATTTTTTTTTTSTTSTTTS